MEKWYGNSWSNVVKEVQTDIYSGLHSSEIENRKNEYGKNIIRLEGKETGVIKHIKNFISVHIIFQVVLASLFIMQGKSFEAGALYISALFFYTFEFYNYNRRIHKFKQIEKLNSGKARCIRDGRIQLLDIEDIVLGDVVLLGEGDIVPADIRVVESEELNVNESSVTGKDEIVEKYETRIYEDVYNLWELKNILFKSSSIVKGKCTGVVVAVGMETQIGKIVGNTKVRKEKDELILSIKTATKRFNYCIWVLILIAALYVLIQKNNIFYIFDFIKLSLYSLYLNLAMLSGIIYYIYMRRLMKQRGVELLNIFSIQKIAGINTLIINDKGFLCEDEMRVKEIFSDGIKVNEFTIELLNEYNMERMLLIAVLCNNSNKTYAIQQDNRKTYVGDISDIGLVKFVEELLWDKSKIEKSNPRVLQIPNDSEKRILTTVNKVDEYFRANIKGDSEEILARCTHIMKNGIEVEITQEDTENIKDIIISMSNNALKVIGFAYRNFNYEPSIDENIESHLVFVGLIGMENTIKHESVLNLKKCERLNLKTIVITENNKLYDYALGKKLGILKSFDEVLSGIELKYMDKDEYNRVVDKIKVFSNIFLESKTMLIQYSKSKGEIIAICSNHFRDLPSFNEADVGIAFDESCSNTVRKISDIFISGNSLDAIIQLIKNCRINAININIALAYYMSVNLSQIILVILQLLFLPNLYISYSFISIINLVCVPLNITWILLRSKYTDEIIEKFHGYRLEIKSRINIVVINSILIVLLIILGIFIVNKIQVLDNIFIAFLIVSLAQFTTKITFAKYEIYI